jgi:small-conductance mechanosensitive channel
MNPFTLKLDEIKLLELTKNLVVSFVLIGLYWFILDKIRKSLRLYVKNLKTRLLVDIIITLFTLVISFITLALAFVDNLNSFFAGLGLISTALVFTLQDFVASFFGWLHLRINHLYGMNDEIIVHAGNIKYSGRVLKVGIFRTYLKTRLGNDSHDSELFLGRTVSFPNHLVLKDAVDNSTRNNTILWHKASWTITFESDYKKAKKLIQEMTQNKFENMIAHKPKYLEVTSNRKNLYKPKVYVNIADDGICFTVWFACNIGYYREVLELFSEEILDIFGQNQISLAYKTIRHIHQNQDLPQNQN